MEFRECPNCHSYVEPGAATCEYCGAAMPTIDESANTNTHSYPTPEQDPIPAETAPIMAQPIKTQGTIKLKWSVPAIVGFVLALVLGARFSIIAVAACIWGIVDAKNKSLKGANLAIAGIVVSVLVIAFTVAVTI